MAEKEATAEDIAVLVRKLREQFSDVLSEPIPTEIEQLLTALEDASDKKCGPTD